MVRVGVIMFMGGCLVVAGTSRAWAQSCNSPCCGKSLKTKVTESSKGKGEKAKSIEKNRILSAYFKIWKALGKDELKGVSKAKEELILALNSAKKNAPEGLSKKELEKRSKILAQIGFNAAKLELDSIKKTRDGLGLVSKDLRSFVEMFPGEADAYIVYCDMAKKSWLQDTPEVLNPYYGASMERCGRVVHRPKWSIYKCPMHPDIQKSSSGKCPKCGMELIHAKCPPGA